jgi:hypothetical protein
MRFRAARATSWSIAMRDYGAHGDRFANKKPHSTRRRPRDEAGDGTPMQRAASPIVDGDKSDKSPSVA